MKMQIKGTAKTSLPICTFEVAIIGSVNPQKQRWSSRISGTLNTQRSENADAQQHERHEKPGQQPSLVVPVIGQCRFRIDIEQEFDQIAGILLEQCPLSSFGVASAGCGSRV